jgi:hypothetical protein
MTTNSRLIPASLLTVLALGGCDAQEPTDYRGDAIWSMKGSLVGENGVASDTEVALLWDGVGAQVLQSTEVEGNFPAEFTLHTYEPPPAKGLYSLAGWDVDVRIGFGNIVAADPSAPFYPRLLGYEGSESVELEPGESIIYDDQEKWLRGGVPAYLVVYLDGKVPESMRCLSSLEQGYNLLALRDFTEAEKRQADACDKRTFGEALAEYNEEHGTDLTDETVEEDEDAYRAVERVAGLKYCQAGCALLKAHSTRVDTNERVTMELEPDVEFVDWN